MAAGFTVWIRIGRIGNGGRSLCEPRNGGVRVLICILLDSFARLQVLRSQQPVMHDRVPSTMSKCGAPPVQPPMHELENNIDAPRTLEQSRRTTIRWTQDNGNACFMQYDDPNFCFQCENWFHGAKSYVEVERYRRAALVWLQDVRGRE
jgi:hypothetical protein